MKSIVLTNELGRGYGHVSRLAAVAESLPDYVRCSLAVRDVAAAGVLHQADRRVWQSPLYVRRTAIKSAMHTYAEVIADGGFADPPALVRLVRCWIDLLELIEPSALIIEHAPVSMLAAFVMKLPGVRVGTGFIVPRRSQLEDLVPWAPAPPTLQRELAGEADEAIATVCRAYGINNEPTLNELLELFPSFLTTFADTDHTGPRKCTTYYGPLRGPSGDAPPKWPVGYGPKVFVYLPFNDPRATVLLRVLGDLRWPTIWHSSHGTAAVSCDTIEVATAPIAIGELTNVTFIASRAGHGITCEALRLGCPQLLLPDRLESALLAYRISRLGLGAIAPSPISSSSLVTVIRCLATNTLMHQRSLEVAKRLSDYNPAIAGLNLASDIFKCLRLEPGL